MSEETAQMASILGDSGERIARTIADRVVDVPDFPKAGIIFKDLGPLFGDGVAFHDIVDAIVEHHGRGTFDEVAGIEARGFLLAAAVAYATGAGVVPVRKGGRLPRPTHTASYSLEYGTATLEIYGDSFVTGRRILVVDDVLATGGTVAATLELIERAGGTVAGLSVLVELEFLGGRERLGPRPVHALLRV